MNRSDSEVAAAVFAAQDKRHHWLELQLGTAGTWPRLSPSVDARSSRVGVSGGGPLRQRPRRGADNAGLSETTSLPQMGWL